MTRGEGQGGLWLESEQVVLGVMMDFVGRWRMPQRCVLKQADHGQASSGRRCLHRCDAGRGALASGRQEMALLSKTKCPR